MTANPSTQRDITDLHCRLLACLLRGPQLVADVRSAGLREPEPPTPYSVALFALIAAPAAADLGARSQAAFDALEQAGGRFALEALAINLERLQRRASAQELAEEVRVLVRWLGES